MKKTALAKFEEFFSTVYCEDVAEILDKYPDERSLTVNYEDLEKFDHDVADLLINHPNECLEISQNAINNINPTMKEDMELNIRFKNVANEISLLNLSSRHIGTLFSIEGCVKSVSKVRPKLHEGMFECRTCMRLDKVVQDIMGPIKEPAICVECGSRSFNLLEKDSSYIDSQKCVLTNLKNELGERDDPVNLNVILIDDLVKKLRVNDVVRLTGIYNVYKDSKNKKFETYFIVNHIEYLSEGYDEVFESLESESSVSRNSLEYANWRNQVFKRDKVCQCCGLDKRLHAHHIFGYEEHPELAYDVNNGIILCQFCHDKYHSVYGLKDINPVKLAKFIRRFSSKGWPLDGN